VIIVPLIACAEIARMLRLLNILLGAALFLTRFLHAATTPQRVASRWSTAHRSG